MDLKVVAFFGLALAVLVSLVVAVNVTNEKNSNLPQEVADSQPSVSVLNEQNWETIQIIRTPDGKIFIASLAMPTNESELAEFKQKSLERVNALENDVVNYRVIATFSKELNEEEVSELSEIAGIYRLKYVAHPEGTGTIGYPLREEEIEYLNKLEQQIISNFSDTGTLCSSQALSKKSEAAKKQCTEYKNFKLVKGFVAGDVVATKEQLLTLAQHQNILTIDVGPVELLQQYPNAIIKPSKDTWHEYSKIVNT
ncbi:MAG: hypothetical protein Q7K34_01075 [archaeon]|nr:hypothetical protein [archaeon]